MEGQRRLAIRVLERPLDSGCGLGGGGAVELAGPLTGRARRRTDLADPNHVVRLKGAQHVRLLAERTALGGRAGCRRQDVGSKLERQPNTSATRAPGETRT